MTQHVTTATHVSGHILDLVLTRSSEGVISDVHTDTLLSDHMVVHFTIDTFKQPTPREKRAVRRFNAIDRKAFVAGIEASGLLGDSSENMDYLIEKYNNVLFRLVDQHAPIVMKTLPIRKRVPWYTDAVRQAKCKRRQMEKKWRSTGLVVHQQKY